MLVFATCRTCARPIATSTRRTLTTLENNPHIVSGELSHHPTAADRFRFPFQYVFPDNQSLNKKHILSLLPTAPPKQQLAIGTTTAVPPHPDHLTENPKFLTILQSVLAEHAHQDQNVISQAQAMASTSGANLGSGGAFFPNQQRRGSQRGPNYRGGGGTGGDGAGGASSQGGAGGAGRGGYIHVYDERRPPDFGRIPEPEDIFGSLEVDGEGRFVDGHGRYQSSGTYRIVTNDGILGLTGFLRQRLFERLKVEEAALG